MQEGDVKDALMKSDVIGDKKLNIAKAEYLAKIGAAAEEDFPAAAEEPRPTIAKNSSHLSAGQPKGGKRKASKKRRNNIKRKTKKRKSIKKKKKRTRC